MDKKRWWIFTFGVGHEVLGGKYVRIYGTFESTRAKMIEMFGKNWAFQYSDDEWNKMEQDTSRRYKLETECKRVIIDTWLTVRDVAVILGLKVRTIRKWIDVGAIRAEKHGKYLMINKKEIERAEVQDRADKGREHSKRIKAGIELGVLARGSKDTEESV